VFRGVDFALTAGAALILRGPNGSGKSSLLRVLAGLTPALGGVIRWDGRDIAEDWPAHRARLHFIGHLDPLKPVLTPAEMLSFWSRLRGGSQEAAERALARFRLDELADLPCRFLSAGQRRRLSLARLLANPSPLWLLDEPTVGLDEASTADLLTAIAEHRAGGGIVLAATHVPLAIDGTLTLPLDQFAPQ
jgi:heme exporter protein A